VSVRERHPHCGEEKSLGPEKSRGSKSILGGRGQGRSALPYGVMADRCSGRNRVITPTACQKKKYRAALQCALSAKLADGQVVIVSNLSLDQPKTKLLARALTHLCAGAYALIVAGAGHAGLVQAAGNLPNVCVVGPEGLNVYDIVRAELILILERELPRVKEVWA